MLAQRMHKLVNKMQKHFSHSPSSYYGDSLFFISIGLFKILDLRIKQIITLDVDIEFRNDIRYLHDHFGKFASDNIIGIARDAQPVYRHLFWQYRNEHPGTRVGAPPPDGLTGFNSGVLLLNLDKIRQSSVYEGLLMDKSIDELTQKYHFKGETAIFLLSSRNKSY
jgi:lipopolysaccharide biosynthesis glycosyltransferase